MSTELIASNFQLLHNPTTTMKVFLVPILGLLGILPTLSAVRVEEIPEKGLQPEIAVGSNGIIHLVYLSGDPKACQVRYTFRKPGEGWQPSKTVNSLPSSAIALGSIRGPQLALGIAGTIHVIWNGVSQPDSPHAPLWYSRKIGESKDFESQRDVLGKTTALDGGASVAADGNGEVIVAWHGNVSGIEPEEKKRFVFVRSSPDEGSAFGDPVTANTDNPGVCACCSLRAYMDPKGDAKIFFRNALGSDHRAMTILSLENRAWKSREIENWPVNACPMSSAALMTVQEKLLGAWETAGKIRAGFIEDTTSVPITLAEKGGKHPVIARNKAGQLLIAWIEGSGWNRGGEAVWMELDPSLKPATSIKRVPGVPAWGKVAAYAEQNGDFIILR